MKRINRILITAMVLVLVAMFANADIPPAPVGLDNDTGDYWVNYTWSKELGDPVDDNVNVTDSFNVSMNGTWYNGTATFLNKSVGPGGWANITVWAYNATGNGNMSVDNVSADVQAPGAATELPRKCGYIPPLMDLSHLGGIPVKGIQAPGDLPGSFDWRDSGNVTPVKDQDPCGTCWAFGTTSVLESAVLINEGAEYNFSEQSVALCVDRSWTYLYNDTDDPCNAGGNSFIASEVFIKKGSVLESCNPYNTTALNCSGSCLCDDCAPVKRVDGYRLVTNDGSEIDVIKNAVYDHGPVTMAFFVNWSAFKTVEPWGTIYDYYPCPPYIGAGWHMVSIIGWNDSVPHPDADHGGTGAWIVKNSWGTGWGNDGYFYLAYNSSCVQGIAYLEYKDPVPDEELLYWDEAGFVGSVGYGDGGAWMASNFTADQSGNLTHVDFWTTSNNAEYEVYVWDGYFGIELANQTGTCQELGYYSIPLNTPIPMAAGQQFTVGANMTTPGYNSPIPVEYKDDGDVNPPIQSNVSFIRHNTSDSWTDMADPEWDKNACLRVRMVATFNCACGDICVNTSGWWRGGSVFNANNTAPIQAAVDGATAGETICVAAGSYEENVNLGTSHLTLAGEGADVVNVTAPAPDGDHVFSVTADYVNISGFNVAGASSGKAGIYLDSADHCNISDNNVSDNGWDIYIMSSESTFTDNTLNGTTVSFIYSGDVSLKGVGSPAADPSGQNTIDKFINATNQSAGAWLYLNFSYSDSDVSGLDESSLAVWKHNGTDWLADGWNGTRYLDATNNLVGANITTFSVFAPMAPATDTTPPVPTNLQNTTGNYWVNYTWTVGTGTVTDGYNVSMNGWHNGTETFLNSSVGAGNWSNITVWAWNATGNGNLSVGNVSDNVQAPAAVVHPAPAITSWDNNKTNNDSTTLTINELESVRFNATANQTIETWHWYKNGADQLSNFDNYTTSWSVNGTNTISVNATNANGTSNTVTWTVIVTDIRPPAQVMNLANDTTTATTVDLSWNANTESDLAGYKVYRNGTLLGSTVNAYHNVTDLSSSTTYKFNVSAYDDNDLEGENASVTVTTAAIVHPAPAITSWDNNKTNNDSTTLTINELESVRFNATANQTIETWHWYKNGADQLSNFDNYTTSWSVNGTNTISVNATNANGTSNTVTWTVIVTDIRPPAQVMNLANDTTTATTVDLSWNANTESDLAGYKVYRNGTLLGSTVNAYHNVTDLSSSTTYKFNVSAYDDNDLEGENASVTVTTAAIVHPAPAITSWDNNKTNNDSTTLTINELESVRFNATANQTIETWHWYKNGADQLSNFDNYTTSWSVNGTNTISVNATNANGTSNTVTWTVIVTDIRPPAQVMNLANDTTTATTVDLSWNANTESDLAGYKVYRNGTLLGSTVNAYHNVTDLSSSTTYKFNVSAYDDNDLEGENASVTVTTAAIVHPAPAITSWDNNKTNNDSTTLTINELESVRFNATANQTIETWHWYKNGADQLSNFDNYTTSWSVNGTNTISVNATNANGTSNTVTWTVIVTDIRPPAQVMNLANDTTTATTVDLSWNANTESDLAGYKVYRNGTLLGSTVNAYHNVTDLSSSTTYKFNVSAYDDNDLEGENASVTVTTAAIVHPAPAITSWDNNKTNNDSTTLTINELESVRFNATANQTTETWHWYKNGADQLSNFDNYTTSWSVNGTNTISVNATNANGTSNTVAWTVTVTDIRPPAQVMNLANDTTTTTTVDLSWNANTEVDLAGYRVYQNGALIDSPPKSRTYYNVTGLSSSTAYEFNVSAYDDNGLEGANASRTVTTAVGPLHHISVTPDSKTLNISESWNFTATGRDQNNGKISGLVFAWARSDTCIGSLNNSTGTVVNFTAGRVGITYITASNGRVTSDPVQVTVNAGTSNTTFANKTNFRAKSGDANATGNFKNNVSGWISATARGNATNSSEVNQSHPRSGLGSGDKVMGGVIVNVSGNITEELAAGNGTIRIQICYNATTLTALGIDASTLAIWKYNSTTEKWMQQSSTTTSEGCAHVDVNHLCTFALVGSKAIGSSTSGSGTYPPGWFGTPTATVTATKAPAASATTTDASHSDKVAPAPTKKPAASTATTPAAEGTTAKNGAPGFTAIFAIAGLLAIAYVLMRRRG